MRAAWRHGWTLAVLALALETADVAEGRGGRRVCTNGHCGQVMRVNGTRRKRFGEGAKALAETGGRPGGGDAALSRGIEQDSYGGYWLKHFLLAEGAAEAERPAPEWKARIESRNAQLAGDPREDRTGRWRELYEEALDWRYPRNGDLATALLYFRFKVEWTRKAFLNPLWMHDADLLEKASLALREMGEWSFPRLAPHVLFRSRQKELLEKSHARNFEELPDAASRKAYRDLVADEGRCDVLAEFQDELQIWSQRMAEELWRHCRQAEIEAGGKGDEEVFRQLEIIRKRIFGSIHPERRLHLRDAVGTYINLSAGFAEGVPGQ